jgi:hypothetical protein
MGSHPEDRTDAAQLLAELQSADIPNLVRTIAQELRFDDPVSNEADDSWWCVAENRQPDRPTQTVAVRMSHQRETLILTVTATHQDNAILENDKEFELASLNRDRCLEWVRRQLDRAAEQLRASA